MDSAEEFRFTPELHPSFDLYKTVKKIYVKPSTLSPGEALVIDRHTEDIALEYLTHMPTPSTRIPIFGVMGIVRMIPCKYLVVIEEKTRVSPESGSKPHLLSNTWRVEKVNLLPVAPGKTRMTSRKSQLNDHYELTMLEIFNSKTFYFSYDIDLSQTLKRISDMDAETAERPGIFFKFKKMFIWNLPILIPFLKLKTASQYIVPVVNGFAGTKVVTVKNIKVYLTVVSRRRRSRSGKRYFCRGINKKGYCANFVESEMIVEIGKTMIGFVLTRGSLPFYWMQWPDLSFNPKPQILYSETSDHAFGKHMEELIREYGDIYMIDSANEYRQPKDYMEFNTFLRTCILETRYATRVTLLNIDLFKLNWANENIHDFEVYSALREIMSTIFIKTTPKQRQRGVFHICSLDGTDLTDIMQFSLAKIALLEVLLYADYGMYDPKALYDILVPELSQLWLENSDSLSFYYVGTKSLGAEFYSTNILERKQTLAHLRIQFHRWWINNFQDGYANDCIDILTRNSSIPENVESGYQQIAMKKWSSFALHVVLPFGLVFSFLHFLLMVKSEWSIWCLAQWSTAVFYSTYLVFKNLHCLVNVPKLTRKPDINRRPSDWYFLRQ